MMMRRKQFLEHQTDTACSWLVCHSATVGGTVRGNTVQIVSTYPASPEARPPSFLGKPAVRPRSMAGGAPTPCGIQNPFLTAQSTQIKSVISVPIKDFIHHYPRALFNDIPRVGAHFYDIPGSGCTFTTYPGRGAV